MEALQTASAAVYQLPMLLLAITFPPVVTGAFWAIAAVFALLSVFFDDEAPRGNPGVDYNELASLGNREMLP
jgi:hypothetical protein